jgi:hypothetical protein
VCDVTATVRRPRTRYTIGTTAAVLILAARVLPDRALDRMTTSDLRKHYPTTTSAPGKIDPTPGRIRRTSP